nr:MAG TPA: hypothetical protein [Caudoviricetes sp.]
MLLLYTNLIRKAHDTRLSGCLSVFELWPTILTHNKRRHFRIRCCNIYRIL